MANVRTRQTIITVAALLHQRDKPRAGQLAEMAAGSLWRHAGGTSELCCSERAPAEQRDEYIGARGIADQRSDFRDLRCIRHN
jgi:hypothetical protein